MIQNRASLTEAELEQERSAAQERMRQSQASLTATEEEEVRSADQMRKRQSRASLTKDQEEAERAADRARKTTPQNRSGDRARKRAKSSSSSLRPGDGRRSDEVLSGEMCVPELKDSLDSIGGMTTVCIHCGALKWQRETSTTCCKNGKVILTSLPLLPDYLNDLYFLNTPEAKFFRKHCRSFNNGFSLSSIKVTQRSFGGQFCPSVIFQGKLYKYAGPLQAGENEVPRFSQLYVMDPALEDTQRVSNMCLPRSISNDETKLTEAIVARLKDEIKAVNPFVRDFIQICEYPEDEQLDGKLVISARARPSGEHERRYNPQLCLNEVSVLTDNQPHDLVLKKRGGGLQEISDLNPAAMPLRFILLFPHGTRGWDPNSQHTDQARRITPREHYVYMINTREGGENRDWITRAGRLFQEFICTAWVTCEDQKLEWQSRNQKTLRADTYKSLRDLQEQQVITFII